MVDYCVCGGGLLGFKELPFGQPACYNNCGCTMYMLNPVVNNLMKVFCIILISGNKALLITYSPPFVILATGVYIHPSG